MSDVSIAGIDDYMFPDSGLRQPHPGTARITVWVALGLTSWAFVVSVSMLAHRLIV